jgi:hypothetical protein
MKQLEYWFDEDREMIEFSNGHRSAVTSCGHFFWKIEGKSVYFHEDMVELQQKTGYIFKQRK